MAAPSEGTITDQALDDAVNRKRDQLISEIDSCIPPAHRKIFAADEGDALVKRSPTHPRGIMKSLQLGEFAMPLQRGEVRGYDFNRMVIEFTMLNRGMIILCAISTAAMDDLEGRRDVKPDQRVDQFMRLREVIEERASRKFFEEQAQADRPVVLRSNDFIR